MKIKSKKFQSLTLDEQNKYLKKQKRGSKIVSFICKTAAILSAVAVVVTAVTMFIVPVTAAVVGGLFAEISSIAIMGYWHADSQEDIKEINGLLEENDNAKRKELRQELNAEKTQQKEKTSKIVSKTVQNESNIEIQA